MSPGDGITITRFIRASSKSIRIQCEAAFIIHQSSIFSELDGYRRLKHPAREVSGGTNGNETLRLESRIAMNHAENANSPRSNAGWIGFTLVELLTVVAVIGILASILLGSLARAKVSARSTICLNQMRQLGVAVSNYMSDNQYYPAVRRRWDAGQRLQFEEWREILAPLLLEGREMYKFSNCSLADVPAYYTTEKTYYSWNSDGAHTDRSKNLGLGGLEWKTADSEPDMFLVTEAMVRAPSEMLMLTEAKYPYSWAGSQEYAVPMWPTERHGGRGNFLFTDGHVERLRPVQVTNPIPEVTRRWNNDHELHPGKFEIY